MVLLWLLVNTKFRLEILVKRAERIEASHVRAVVQIATRITTAEHKIKGGVLG